jgi:hypothetical protein
MAAVLVQIMTEEPPDPAKLREDLDPRLKQICRKMMAKRIEDRYASMQEVSEALSSYLHGQEDMAEPSMEPSPTADTEEPVKEMFATRFAARSGDSATRKPKTHTSLPAARPLLQSPALWLTVCTIFAVFVLLGAVVLLRTEHGTVRFELNDPHLQVTVDGNEYTIEQLQGPLRLPAGRHELRIRLGDQEIGVGETVRLQTATHDGQYKLSVTVGEAQLLANGFVVVKGEQQSAKVELTKVETATNIHDEPEKSRVRDEQLASASNSGFGEQPDAQESRGLHESLLDSNRDSLTETELVQQSPSGSPPLALHLNRIDDVRVVGEQLGTILAIAMSSGGRLAASAGGAEYDNRGNVVGVLDPSICIWDLESGDLAASLVGHQGPVSGLAFSTDARQLVSVSHDATVRLWDLESHEETACLNGDGTEIQCVAISHTGDLIACGEANGKVVIWDVASGRRRHVLQAHGDVGLGRSVVCVAFSSDAQRLISAGEDRTLQIWELRDGSRRAVMQGHSDSILCLAGMPNCQFAISGGRDGT